MSFELYHFFIFISWHYIAKKSFPFFLIICLYQYGLLEYYFIQQVYSLIICYYTYSLIICVYFGAQLSNCRPFKLAPVYFDMSPSFFEPLLTLGAIKCSRFILYISCPSPGNCCFS